MHPALLGLDETFGSIDELLDLYPEIFNDEGLEGDAWNVFTEDLEDYNQQDCREGAWDACQYWWFDELLFPLGFTDQVCVESFLDGDVYIPDSAHEYCERDIETSFNIDVFYDPFEDDFDSLSEQQLHQFIVDSGFYTVPAW